MINVKVAQSILNGVLLIEPMVHGDERGFKEVIHPQKMDALGIRHDLCKRISHDHNNGH